MRTWLYSTVFFLSSLALVHCSSDDSASPGSSDAGSDAQPPTDSGVPDTGTTNTDSGTPTDSGADAGPFTPASLSGLSLWLDGDSITGVAGKVATWPDQSSKHNDAAQSTEANQPTLTAAASGIHGHAVATFDGSTSFLTIPDATSLQLDGTGFFIEAVLEYPARTGGDSYFSKYAAASPNAGPYLYLDHFSSTGNPAAFGVNLSGSVSFPGTVFFQSSAPHRVRARFTASTDGGTGGTLGVTVDVGPELTDPVATVPDLSATGVPVSIGRNSGGVSPFMGEIATIIVVKGPTTDAEQAALDAYVTARFGL